VNGTAIIDPMNRIQTRVAARCEFRTQQKPTRPQQCTSQTIARLESHLIAIARPNNHPRSLSDADTLLLRNRSRHRSNPARQPRIRVLKPRVFLPTRLARNLNFRLSGMIQSKIPSAVFCACMDRRCRAVPCRRKRETHRGFHIKLVNLRIGLTTRTAHRSGSQKIPSTATGEFRLDCHISSGLNCSALPKIQPREIMYSCM
jgi:hypothetical protein